MSRFQSPNGQIPLPLPPPNAPGPRAPIEADSPSASHMIPAAFLDVPCNLSLATHRVERHDTTQQFQLPQQLRHRHHLIRTLIRFYLPRHDTFTACPRTDHIQRLYSTYAIMRTPLGLTVQRDELAFTELYRIFHVPEEAFLKPADRQCRDNSCNGVINWHPVRQPNIPAKPPQLRASELLESHHTSAPLTTAYTHSTITSISSRFLCKSSDKPRNRPADG